MHNRLGEYLTAAYPAGGWMVQDDGNGPYIKEWALAAAQPTEQDVDEWAAREDARLRRADIQRELDAIDMQSVRPLRAKLAGTATAEDEARLASLETQAQTLRAELAGLPQ